MYLNYYFPPNRRYPYDITPKFPTMPFSSWSRLKCSHCSLYGWCTGHCFPRYKKYVDVSDSLIPTITILDKIRENKKMEDNNKKLMNENNHVTNHHVEADECGDTEIFCNELEIKVEVSNPLDEHPVNLDFLFADVDGHFDVRLSVEEARSLAERLVKASDYVNEQVNQFPKREF